MKVFIMQMLLLLMGQVSACASIADFFAYYNDCVQEKLHLTLDRPYYEAGDTIWFRGTLVSADDLSYMIKSNYITVELYNLKGELQIRRKVARSGLCFHHCLSLNSDLPEGEYILTAYTSWMRNFSEDLFFKRKVFVSNPHNSSEKKADAIQSIDFSVQFFPEGGARINQDLYSQRIAFAAVGSDGYPLEVDGVLLSGVNQSLDSVHSLHDGMGTFCLKGHSSVVKARFTVRGYADPSGLPLTKTFQLPTVADDTMSVALQFDGAKCRVLGSRRDSLRLVLHHGTRLLSNQMVHVGDEVAIDTAMCMNGINQLLITTSDAVSLSQRLFFKTTHLSSRQSVSITPSVCSNRSLQHISLQIQDLVDHPSFGDFSVSIYDEDYVSPTPFKYDDNIQSHFLLTSDLKGYIHQPAWYFQADCNRANELDLLMLTHGWSRFSIDTLCVAYQKTFLQHPLEQSEWLSGQILNLKKKEQGQHLPISVYDSAGVSFGMGKLDSQGRFFIGDLNYPNNSPLEVRVLSASKKPYFRFDAPTFPAFSFAEPIGRQRFLQDESSSSFNLLGGERVRLLKDVDVSAQRRDTSEYTGGKILFQGSASGEELQGMIDMNIYNTAYDAVKYIMEHNWSGHWDESERIRYHVIYADRTRAFASRSLPMVDVLSQIRVDKIDRITMTTSTGKITKPQDRLRVSFEERYNNPMFSQTVHDIRVFLRPGYKFEGDPINLRHRTYLAFGYTPLVEFYHPVYSTETERSSPEPDFRKTLYWNPSIQTNRQGRVEFDYYESDHTDSPRRIVVEGVSLTGIPIHFEKVFNHK